MLLPTFAPRLFLFIHVVGHVTSFYTICRIGVLMFQILLVCSVESSLHSSLLYASHFSSKVLREVIWNVENLRNLVDRNQGKEVDGKGAFVQ